MNVNRVHAVLEQVQTAWTAWTAARPHGTACIDCTACTDSASTRDRALCPLLHSWKLRSRLYGMAHQLVLDAASGGFDLSSDAAVRAYIGRVALRMLKPPLCACDLDWFFDFAGYTTWDAVALALGREALASTFGNEVAVRMVEELMFAGRASLWRVLGKRGLRLTADLWPWALRLRIKVEPIALVAMLDITPWPLPPACAHMVGRMATCTVEGLDYNPCAMRQLGATLAHEYGVTMPLDHLTTAGNEGVTAMFVSGFARPINLAIPRARWSSRWAMDGPQWHAAVRHAAWVRRLPALARYVRIRRLSA